MDSKPPLPPGSSRSWSIYGRPEITQRYEILGRVGSGAYADVYRGRRVSDGLTVALKEIHDYQSAFREIEALQLLRGAPNVVELLEYFWHDDEDAVLVLEFLQSDLASVIREAKKRGEGGGVPVGEAKQWMIQLLRGVEACHTSGVVHRDLKPSNLLISSQGVLKLADFGQSRILQETVPLCGDGSTETWIPHHLPVSDTETSQSQNESKAIREEDYLRELDALKVKYSTAETVSLADGDTSCRATCSTGDVDDVSFQGHYPYESYEGEDINNSGELTSCVGTRWFRAPELLYGSTNYAQEIDLWSLGCIFAELFSLDPLFPGISDIDQLGRIISTLGDITEEIWSGCSKLPDYGKISFNKVERPSGLESLLPCRSSAEVAIVKRLVCYDPKNRATATQLLEDIYFSDYPLPVPLTQLKVPAKITEGEESSPGDWVDHRDMDSDSDNEFANMDISTTEKGWSVKFS